MVQTWYCNFSFTESVERFDIENFINIQQKYLPSKPVWQI